MRVSFLSYIAHCRITIANLHFPGLSIAFRPLPRLLCHPAAVLRLTSRRYHPVLLGAINAGSGNRPPWTLPAKATYLSLDSARSLSRVSLPPSITPPPDFMARANTLLPLRSLTHVKRVSPEKLVPVLSQLFRAFWVDHSDLNDRAVLRQVLLQVVPNSGPGFGEKEVDQVLEAAGRDDVKGEVKKRTSEALEKGAFGAPWIWATNASGKAEPFFGSDRFHFVYRHLGIPFEDLKISPPTLGKL